MRRTVAVIVVAVAAVVAGYAVGANRGAGDDRPAAASPHAQPTTQPATTPEPKRTAMDEPAFWRLISETRSAADNDTGRQSGLLEERLRRLSPQAIVDFQRIRHRLDERAYTWDLWGAAYVIEDGCSDDCFRDFRAYLISLGKGPYTAALRDPDSIAPVVEDAEQGDWENADSVAGDAYESVTGDDLPVDDSDLSGNPRGQEWDSEDEDALARRYPRLAARFR